METKNNKMLKVVALILFIYLAYAIYNYYYDDNASVSNTSTSKKTSQDVEITSQLVTAAQKAQKDAANLSASVRADMCKLALDLYNEDKVTFFPCRVLSLIPHVTRDHSKYARRVAKELTDAQFYYLFAECYKKNIGDPVFKADGCGGYTTYIAIIETRLRDLLLA